MHRARAFRLLALALAGLTGLSCGSDSGPAKDQSVTVGDSGPKLSDGQHPGGDARPPKPCTTSGPEVCDGVDNDCNGKTDEGFTLLCAPCPSGAKTCIEAKLTGGAFRVGVWRNLVIGNDQGIALPPLPRPQPYIYIANSGEDTVSKIRTSDAVEVGRFLVGDNPSRTAVDGNGDAWVAMRGAVGDISGTGPSENVVKIAGDCTPKTKPPTPTRECILMDIPAVGNLLRGVAIDAHNDVWIGSYATSEVIRLDGMLGMVQERITVPGHPYGLAIDENGYLWISAHDQSTYSSGQVIRVDTALKVADINLDSSKIEFHSTYGLAADGEGGIWYAAYGSAVFRIDALTGAYGPVHDTGGGTITRGVAVDDKGYLWAADSANEQLLRVDRATGATKAVKVGWGPVGVAVDHEGNIWSVNNVSGDATKVSPDGTVLKTVVVGSDPYTYSDMTGTAYRIFRKMKGTFTASYDVGLAGAKWTQVRWVGNVPAPSTFTLRVRAADDDPAKASWQDVSFSGPTATLTAVGARLQLEARLSTDDRQALPNVESLTFTIQR